MAGSGGESAAVPTTARGDVIRKIALIIVLALIAVAVYAAAAAYGEGRVVAAQEKDAAAEEVVALVQRFFDALNASDADAAREVLVADGQFYSVREGEDGPLTRVVTHPEFLASLERGGEAVRERMFDPTVTTHGRVAMVWAPYDFHVEGEFSHCGVDIFSLVYADEGWKIAGITYSVESSGCEPIAPQ